MTRFDGSSSGTTGQPGVSRSVRINQPCVRTAHRVDGMTFLLPLLNTLKTGGMLPMKFEKLHALLGLWQKKKLGAKFVRAESVGLAQRAVQCDGVRTDGADDADDSCESDDCSTESLLQH
jgi:hypothetical protein